MGAMRSVQAGGAAAGGDLGGQVGVLGRQFGVTRQSVHRWHARFKQADTQALRSGGRPATGPACPTLILSG